jgi:hypothetical protein
MDDRRQYTRKKAPGNLVYVYYRGRRIHRSMACDISPKGVFIKTPGLAVPLGARVQLLFAISQGTVTRTHRKNAVVTRICGHGAGFGFMIRRRASA